MQLTPQARREASIGLLLPPHPHLASTLSAEVISNETALLLVMELAPGENVVHWLDHTGPMPLDEVRTVLRGVALGLHHMHSNGVAHRG